MKTVQTKGLVSALVAMAAIVVGFGIISVLQGKMETMKSQHLDFGELLWVPDWKIPHILALGDDDTAADLLWVRSTFYVGAYHGHHEHHHEGQGEHEPHHSEYGIHHRDHENHVSSVEPEAPDSVDFQDVDLRQIPAIRNALQPHLGREDARHMFHLFNVITNLDPLFVTPYYQGAMYLTLMTGRWEEALMLLDKGIRHRSDRWEMPYFKGFIHLFFMNDKLGAAREIRTAATKRDAPVFVVRLAAALQVGLGRIETAIEFLKTLAEVTEDEELKRQIEDIILKYEHQRRAMGEG